MLGFALFACSGAVEGPGSGGPVGGLPSLGANFAEGTLSSQSGYQELDDGCASDFQLRFAGEGREGEGWWIRGAEPAGFPQAQVGKMDFKEESLQPCLDCGGRVLRVVDLGEVPGNFLTVQNHRFQMILWWMALKRDDWDPELLPAASYRDFAVGASGEVDLTGQSMGSGHLYYFLLSREPRVSVTTDTAFASMQEFNEMASCEKPIGQETSAFFMLRLVHALDKPPVEFKPIPLPQNEGNEEGSSNFMLRRSVPRIQVSP